VLLREGGVEALAVEDRVEVVLEQVPLHVHDELLARHRLLGRLRLGRGFGRDIEPAAGLGGRNLGRRTVRLARARVEREQDGRGRAQRAQERSARDPQAGSVVRARIQGPATGLARDRRGREGVVLAVRARAERDGQLVVAHVAWQTSSGAGRFRAMLGSA
jgi:hypothetical protein